MNLQHLTDPLDGMTLRRQSETKISLQNLLSLIRAFVDKILVYLVHGTLFWILTLFDQVLDSAILLELLPVVIVIEHFIHCDGYFATRLTNHAWMVVLSSEIKVTNSTLLTSNC